MGADEMSEYYDWDKRIVGIHERFEQQKENKLEKIDDSLTHGKEYYYLLGWCGGGQKKVNFTMAYCNGKLYYIEQDYVFESNDDGTNPKILVRISDYFKSGKPNTIYASKIFLEVNSTGIYLQHFEKKFTVLSFTLDGKYKNTMTLNGKIIMPYIHGKRLYYVLVKGGTKEVACYADIETGRGGTILETSKVLEICGDMQKVVMKARFTKTKNGTTVTETGSYLYDFSKEECVCLTSENAQPHRVLKFTDEFIPGSDKFVQDKKSIEIRMVDIVRNIMWVAIPLKEKTEDGIKVQEYWEAMELKKEGKPIVNAPIWRITTSQLVAGTFGYNIKDSTFFDGNHFLNGRGVSTMKFYNVSGKSMDFANRTNGGACNKYRVLNGYVYSDFEQMGCEQYRLCDDKMEFVKECWFAREHVAIGEDMPPVDITEYITEFENREK